MYGLGVDSGVACSCLDCLLHFLASTIAQRCDDAQDCYLTYILNELQGNSFMIFCSTCNNAQRSTLLLRDLGFDAICLHGQMGQVSAE